MIVFKILWLIPHVVLIYYLLWPFVLVCLVFLRKYLPRKDLLAGKELKNYDFAAIVTAHRQSIFIEPLIESLKNQVYKNIFIYVVADDIEQDLSHLNSSNVKVIQPQPPLHAKTKSIELAIKNFSHKHDALSVFDADNLVHPDFFKIMNDYFNMGYKAVQGSIKAKNLNTQAARMDAANETYYSFIDKYSRARLGLSSGTWGLGFCIDVDIFTSIKFDHYFSGFDKKLQSELITLVDKVGYSEFAIIYDEKTSTNEGLITQRSKWLFGYFHYYKLGFKVIKHAIKTLSFDALNYGINHMRPPLVLIVPGAFLLGVFDFFFMRQTSVIMLASVVIFLIAFAMIQLRYGYDSRVWSSLNQLPKFIFMQLSSLLRFRKAKIHTHTPHEVAINIDEVMNMYQK